MEKDWRAVADADPSCLHALAELAASAVHAALEGREDQSEASVHALGRAAIVRIKEALACCGAFQKGQVSQHWLSLGQQYEQRIRACLELDYALMLDFCTAEESERGKEGEDNEKVSRSGCAASAHYERAALLDQSERRTWQLWAACVARDASLGDDDARLLAAAEVHRAAVQRGLWLREEQRPLQLVPSLAQSASPWLDPTSNAVCVALGRNYEAIRAEGLALLEGREGSVTPGAVFETSRSDASVRSLAVLSGGGLAEGAATEGWRDVSLFVNGRRHEKHASLAPFTSALLCGDEGGLLRDCTSCVYGSAFFSLLSAGTRLRPHCGPTNTRLRAHLPLLVPHGECAMRVGRAPPRGWVEGEPLLFDDSFEHEVWNETEAPRLVLIVDLWHPMLDTDEKRLATLDAPRAARYRRIVREHHFEAFEASRDDADGARPEQSQRSKVCRLTGLSMDTHRRALGGAAGVRRLLGCLDQPVPVPVPVSLPVAVPVNATSSLQSPGPAAPVAMAFATPAEPAKVLAGAARQHLRPLLLPLAEELDWREGLRAAERAAGGFRVDAGTLRPLIRAEHASCLRPLSWFVAWNGVLAIVFTGFPPPMARLKARLNEAPLPLKRENFGSKWPKATIGALADDAPPFTLDELQRLRSVCEQHARRLKGLAVRVTGVSLVSYSARGLEADGRRCQLDIPFVPPPTPDEERQPPPTEDEMSRVRGVLAEWSDLGDYLPRANAPGSRIGSYRDASPSGETLVSFLAQAAPAELWECLAAFRAAVDTLLPGRYAWMASDSLHCTVRALDLTDSSAATG
jgi:hypothetical protein